MKQKLIKLAGIFFTSLTGIASVLIIVMVSIILGNIIYHGLPDISWKFLSSAPESGMTGGGIFPAIYATGALVILMTLAVLPLRNICRNLSSRICSSRVKICLFSTLSYP